METMIPRLLSPAQQRSFFLFGPRGTGKTHWVRHHFPQAIFFDLLESETYQRLLANPQSLADRIPSKHRDWVVLDEVQKIPTLLDEVHRLIESRGYRFILTGSSARKLKRGGANLLAGRARTLHLFPLTAAELGSRFSLSHALRIGNLPQSYRERPSGTFLKDYVGTYLKEEIQAEGLTRNLPGFARFLESASFSQASLLNVAAVARDCMLERKTVEGYFTILEDLLLATRLPPFAKRAQRALRGHSKFFFFDVGVYRAIRPRGPLDSPEEVDGAALETLVWQECRALNEYLDLGHEFYHWRTTSGLEVDLVAYGERGIRALEVKRTARLRSDDFAGLRAFRDDYKIAKCYLIYGGTRRFIQHDIDVIPIGEAMGELPRLLA